MIKEPNIPEGAQTVTLDVQLEVYLRRKETPLMLIGTFYFNREHLADEEPVESFMAIVANTIRHAMYDRSQPVMILSDEKGNKFFVELADVQALSALAPSAATIRKAITRSEEE